MWERKKKHQKKIKRKEWLGTILSTPQKMENGSEGVKKILYIETHVI